MRRALLPLLVLLLPRVALAQAVPEAPATISPPPPAPLDEARVKAIEDQLKALKEQNDGLKTQVESLKQQQALVPATPPPAPPPPPTLVLTPAEGLVTTINGYPIRFAGSMALRYDYWHNSDLTDSLTNNWVNNGLRMRVRFGAEFGDAKSSMLVGGIRMSTGENPNPTVPFIALGDSLRASSFNLDQAWIAIRPFEDRKRLSIALGRMPNQTFRGNVGAWRSEMLFDDDVNPEGIAAKVTILELGHDASAITVQNLAAYYQIQETQDQRFVGLTGITMLWQDQLLVSNKYFDLAAMYLDWENLNNGLSSPGFVPGAVSTQTPADAFLLRQGLNTGNSRFAYGPQQAIGFASDHFRIFDLTGQAKLPLVSEKLGNPDIFVLGEYAHNFTTRNGRNGGGAVTVGARIGDYTKASALNPLNFWFTYRHVQEDTTVAAIADSDLGAGTGFHGFETAINYRITKHLMPQISYFDYHGFPNQENHAQRIFLDMVGDF